MIRHLNRVRPRGRRDVDCSYCEGSKFHGDTVKDRRLAIREAKELWAWGTTEGTENASQ